jgi:hypothetical protein
MAEASLGGALPGTASRVRWRTAVLPPVAALAAYLGLAFGAFASAWRDPLHLAIGVRGDPSQVAWFMAWFPYAAAHGLNPFFTDHIDYPAGVNLMWNTSMPLVAYLLAPATAVSPVLAYDLLETLSLALSAWTGYLLLRRCVSSQLAAAAGGLLYGFSPYMFAQSLGHSQLTAAALPPLILLLLDEIVRVQRRPPVLLGAGLALAAIAQFFVAEEVLVVTGLTAAVLLVVAVALWPHQAVARTRRAVPALLLAGGLFAAAVAWPVAFQLLGPRHISGTPHEQGLYVNDLLGFWVPSPVQWLAPPGALRISERFSGNSSEWNSYLGIPLSLLLAFTAIRWWRNGWVRVAALAGAVVAILSLGITVHIAGVDRPWLPVFAVGLVFLLLPRGAPARLLVALTLVAWLALWRLPLLDSLLPARLMLLVYLLAGLLLAVFLDELVGVGRVRLAAGAAAVAVALVPLVPRLPYLASDLRDPAFFAAGGGVQRVSEGSVALVAPVSTWDDVDAMRWQARSGMRFRMPEGYAFVPAPPPAGSRLDSPPGATVDALVGVEHGGASPAGDERVRQAILAELAAWRVRTVIVGPMPNRDATVALLTWVLGRPPEQVDGVSVWWDVSPTR